MWPMSRPDCRSSATFTASKSATDSCSNDELSLNVADWFVGWVYPSHPMWR